MTLVMALCHGYFAHTKCEVQMPLLTLPVVLQLAVVHAPAVAPETVAAFAQAESRLDPPAVHDNTSGLRYMPRTLAEAVALARSLLAQEHSLDLGLMQINDANLRRTGLTVESAFDPGRSVGAGAQIMVAAYRRCQQGRGEPDALRCMASIYNTGREQAGLLNGYVARVWKAADVVVPAIPKAVDAASSPTFPAPSSPPPLSPCGAPPPSWDGWAVADHQRCLSRAASHPTQEKTE